MKRLKIYFILLACLSLTLGSAPIGHAREGSSPDVDRLFVEITLPDGSVLKIFGHEELDSKGFWNSKGHTVNQMTQNKRRYFFIWRKAFLKILGKALVKSHKAFYMHRSSYPHPFRRTKKILQKIDRLLWSQSGLLAFPKIDRLSLGIRLGGTASIEKFWEDDPENSEAKQDLDFPSMGKPLVGLAMFIGVRFIISKGRLMVPITIDIFPAQRSLYRIPPGMEVGLSAIGTVTAGYEGDGDPPLSEIEDWEETLTHGFVGAMSRETERGFSGHLSFGAGTSAPIYKGKRINLTFSSLVEQSLRGAVLTGDWFQMKLPQLISTNPIVETIQFKGQAVLNRCSSALLSIFTSY